MACAAEHRSAGASAEAPLFSFADARGVSLVMEALAPDTRQPSALLCRDEELGRVLSFCEERFTVSHSPGSLYLSGLPGGGKSLTLRALEEAARGWANAPLVVSVNCLSLSEPRTVRCRRGTGVLVRSPHAQVFARLIEGLGGGEAVAAGSGSPQAVTDTPPEVLLLRRLLTDPSAARKRKRPSSSGSGAVRALLIVDELDVLSRFPWVLTELFSLTSLPGALCVLVAAANTMNLTESLLPRGLLGAEPTLVPFPAYTVAQLGRLLRARLQTLPWPVFDEMALDLCARKVAAASGDCRCALQAARESFIAAQQEAAQASADCEPAPSRVRMSHMAEALSQIFKSAQVTTIKDMPSDEKLVLCALVLLMRSSGTREVTQVALFSYYQELCRQQSVRSTLAKLPFDSACKALACYSLVTCEGGSKRRIILAASVEDVVFALTSNHFFARMLSTDGQASA